MSPVVLLNPETVKECHRLVNEERMSQREVAMLMGFSRSTVERAIKIYTGETRKNGKPKMTEEKAIRAVRAFYKKYGRKIKSTDLRAHEGKLPTYYAVNYYFGSLNRMNEELWEDRYSTHGNRKCLICDRMFPSRDAGHRICKRDGCVRPDDEASEYVDGDPSWLTGTMNAWPVGRGRWLPSNRDYW